MQDVKTSIYHLSCIPNKGVFKELHIPGSIQLYTILVLPTQVMTTEQLPSIFHSLL